MTTFLLAFNPMWSHRLQSTASADSLMTLEIIGRPLRVGRVDTSLAPASGTYHGIRW